MRNIESKSEGYPFSSAEFNSIQNELENIVTSTGDTLDNPGGPDNDLNMLGKAVAVYSQGGQFYNDSGSVNAYSLARPANLKNPDAYFDGMTVLFQAANANSGASTINVASIGSKDLEFPDGTALHSGTISPSGFTFATYNSTDDRFETVGTIYVAGGDVYIAGRKIFDSTSLTASASEINASSDGIGVTIPRQKILEMGDWNMDSTASITVAHGLDDSKIIGARALIRRDDDAARWVIGPYNPGVNNAGFSGIDGTNITMEREPGGDYDNTNYDSTSYNRGWIIVDYID